MKSFIVYHIITTLIILFCIIGEGLCVYKFFTSDFEPSYKREAIYGFSSITGIGSIVGWINIEDTKE